MLIQKIAWFLAMTTKNKNKKLKIVFKCFSYLLLAFAVGFSFTACKSNKGAASQNKTQIGGGKELSDKDRVDFEYFFFNANKEKILGNYDLAETLFSQALRIYPSSAATMYELANIYAFQNNKNQALFYSKRAADADPANIWYQQLYTEALKENKQFSEVGKVYEKLIKLYPERIDFYYDLGNAYLYVNKPSDAIKVYDKIETRIGITEDASMQKLKIYRSSRNFEKAIAEAKKLIASFPKESKYYGILGELYQDMGQNEKALDAYNDLLKVDPNNAYVHLSLADYYRALKQNEKAFEEIKIAFKSADLDIDTKVKILLSYYSITETYTELKSDADELCKIIVEVHPDDAKAFSIYGDFLYRDKKLEEARIQFRKSIALDKEKYALWNQLLTINAELNDYEAMAKEGAEAIELFPNQPVFYLMAGAAHLQLKNYQIAVKQLEEGVAFVYDNPVLMAQFYTYIGDAQNQLKDYAASDAAYDKSLKIEPNNSYVLNNYAYYLSLRKVNLEKAEQMSKKSNELEPNNNSYQDTYGWILYQSGKFEDAKIWIGKAIENGGKNNGTLLEHYGDILYNLNDKEGALKYWNDAKKLGGTTDLIDKKIAEKKLFESSQP